MCHRPGWTRTEVVVALLILVLFVGTLLAAFVRIRSDAASMTCTNNLRQLGLATHNYYDTTSRLPHLADQGDGAPTGMGLPSVFAMLIPYTEATPFSFRPDRPATDYNGHSSIPFTYRNKDGTTGSVPGGIANHPWTVFTDPADNTAHQLRDIPMTLADGSVGHYATGSYAANGMAPWGKRMPPATAQSALILFGERPQVCTTANGDTVYNLWGVGFYSPHMPAFAALTPADPPGLLSTDQVAPVTPLPEDGNEIRVRIGRQDAVPQAPDFLDPAPFVRPGRPCDPRLPGTPHSMGLHAVMADGSVRVFAPDTSPWVFWRACVPAETGVVP